MNVLITGGNGYIANSLNIALSNYKITTITRKDFDLTNKELVDKWFKGRHFDVVIHTATVGGSRLKKDSSDVLYNNLKMAYNLLDNKQHFDKFIQFGSGAEHAQPNSPYGLSKRVIHDIIKQYPNFYNLRIYGVFDSNEISTRFIRNSITNYINHKPIIIYKDKFMDFIHMKDLANIVKSCIIGKLDGGEYNCVYKNKYKLSDIATLINTLSDYSVDIIIKNSGLDTAYIGDYQSSSSTSVGIKKGIQDTYYRLKSKIEHL